MLEDLVAGQVTLGTVWLLGVSMGLTACTVTCLPFMGTWALGRAEYLSSEGRLDATGGTERHTGIGVSAKLEAELYLSGVGISPDGIFLGTYAIGLYVEGAVRRLHDDVSDLQLGVGLTIRTPMGWTW